MKITCQSCQSKYNVADEKVQGKIVKIRCRKCGATIVVNGTEGGAATNGTPTETASVGPQPPSGGEGQWHVNVSDTDQRSMSLAEVVEAYNSGVITQETFIWTDGMDDWKPLSEVEAVVAALHASQPAAAAAPQAAPAPALEAPPVAAPAPSPAFAAPAAAAAQLAAPAPEPKRAAVKREARGRDLFGTTDDVQTSASASPAAAGLAPAADDGKGLTGQRNESSVLFSLAVLTKSENQPAAAQPSGSKTKEDSGLIDLKALAAKAESMRPAAPVAEAFSAPLGAAPLPLGPPLGAVTPSGDEVQPKSKLPLILGGAIGAVVLIVMSVVVTVKLVGGGAAAAAASAATSAPSAVASTDTTASATASAPVASAAPTASAAPSTALASKSKPGAGGYVAHGQNQGKLPGTGGTAGTAGAGGTAGTAGTGGAAGTGGTGGTPHPHGNDACSASCNGDLMCLMQCSSKH
jgi:predicted Zn finger-like uncharacterized protein